jgi:phosphopentomutase
MKKRVFLIVLDSCGAGQMPDCERFGDRDCHTIKRISTSDKFSCENLRKMGIGHIDGLEFLGKVDAPTARVARLTEKSMGKDTTIGHWEIAGIVSENPLPTYPDGFPQELLDKIEAATGIGTLCNKPYSGTDVIRDYGEEQRRTGKMIVYTSADSVYQAAAHEDVIPLEALYAYCEKARKILCGDHAVGRVIARPYVGAHPHYTRTANRHDYALQAPATTMLDELTKGGYATITIGKISDIFAGRGVSRRIPTKSNADGLAKTDEVFSEDFEGLCFVNLVDFDSQYGHRNDVDGYAKAISEFDHWLGGFLPKLKEDDLLIVTADHGCDPGNESTDHSREYIPILAYRKGITPRDIGTRATFSDIGKTVCHLFGVGQTLPGMSFAGAILPPGATELMAAAKDALQYAYAPYSGYTVGAALLCEDGEVVTGCNVESAAFSPTSCAERTALVKAMSEGKRRFTALAVAGGRNGVPEAGCTPCGVCRQFLYELCGGDLAVILDKGDGELEICTLNDLLPRGFSGKSFL